MTEIAEHTHTMLLLKYGNVNNMFELWTADKIKITDAEKSIMNVMLNEQLGQGMEGHVRDDGRIRWFEVTIDVLSKE